MSLRWTEEEYRDWLAGRQAQTPAETGTREKQNRCSEVPSEDEEQVMLFEWAERMTGRWPELEWLYHVPNGGSRNRAEAGKLKAMGVKSGVPDVALDTARGGFHGLRVEMKRREGGRVSEAQKRWIEHLNGEGFLAVVCEGWEAAAKVILEYLKAGEGM